MRLSCEWGRNPIVAQFCPCYPNLHRDFPEWVGVCCGLEMFLSTFEGSIDARGRVLVPSSFRALLGGAQKFFLYPDSSGAGCLEGGGQELMDKHVTLFNNLPPNSKDRVAFVNAIFSKTSEITMDQAGRAVIPPMLLTQAGIEKDLLFVGAMDRFQIWNPERYANFDADHSEHAINNQDALIQPYYEARDGKTWGGNS